jgi:hypothetical protein
MRRRVMLCLTLIAMSACNGDKVVQPTDAPTNPSNAISDGNNCVVAGTVCTIGNPDFFFLPPMVQNASTSPEWDAGAFNADLEPIVKICASKALVVADIPTAECIAEADRIAVADAGAEHYAVNWIVPSTSTIYFRIAVVVGTTTLGYADLETGSNASQLKKVGTSESIPLVDGRTLPIKFRVERFALCEVAGVGPCATKTVNVNAAAKISTALVSDKDDGIIFGGSTTTTTSSKKTVTVERCVDFHVREITDLPTFGPCVRVRVEPALTAALTTPALVYSCDVTTTSAVNTVSAKQAERIAMHRLVGDKLEALPHDHPDCTTSTSSKASVRSMLANLARGRLGSAARQIGAMLAPRPLYAARFIDQGGGGYTHLEDEAEGSGRSISVTGGARLSVSLAGGRPVHEFQFLLPAKFAFIETPTDRAAYPEDALSVSVKVTDLGDEPVMGARLRFSADQGGAVSDAIKYTSSDAGSRGIATVTWTVKPPSPNTLTVTGRGVGGEDVHGPRARTADKIDPFQPCDADWEPVGSPLTCVVTNKATGVGTGTMKVAAITVGDITGSVVNEQTGTAIVAGVSYTPNSPSVPTVSSDGTFLIEDLTPGPRISKPLPYSLTFTAPKFETRVRGGVEVKPKETTNLGVVCLIPTPGKISGSVVSALHNTAIVGATVTTVVTVEKVEKCNIEASSYSVTTTTTEGGVFSLEVPPGSYAVIATARPEYEDGTPVAAEVSAAATTPLAAPIALKWKFGQISGVVVDLADNTKTIANAAITATAVSLDTPVPTATSSPVTLTATTNSDGRFSLEKLAPGSYSLTLQADDYLDATVDAQALANVNSTLPAITMRSKYGQITGSVISNFDGSAIAGATVSLASATTMTTTTASDGSFAFARVPIGTHSVTVTATGFVGGTRAGIAVAGGETSAIGALRLVPLFVSGFETSDADWVNSGFWHPSTLAGITNGAFPSLVSLGIGDGSGGALPAPFAGQRSLWFGSDEHGNYAGPLANTTQSGGTSTGVRSGTARSPQFLVPNTTDQVRVAFQSWFEIESVNPTTFDLMEVYVQPAGASPVLLARLNPTVDPGGNSRLPMTSGGFNRAPIWKDMTVDISAYRGRQVTLQFVFNTRDNLYNGFRGWIVDDVRMQAGTSGASLISIPLRATFDDVPTETPTRTWTP